MDKDYQVPYLALITYAMHPLLVVVQIGKETRNICTLPMEWTWTIVFSAAEVAFLAPEPKG